MALAILDLVDCNVQLWHADLRTQSPGYALLQGDDYQFGAEARAAARMHPRNVNTRYWWQLNTEALQPALGPARHTADLAHNHLLALHRETGAPNEVMMAVSSSMQPEQLSLLLGVTQTCPFDAVGLVNRSVALGSLHAHQETLWHLEIQLHQALLTQLRRANDKIELQRCIAVPGSGMLQLQDRLIEKIAAAFVRQTRFDPRQQAGTEQALYDALPAALISLQQGSEANIEVQGYQARLGREDLSAVGRDFVASIEQFDVAGADILCDPLAALLPGLVESLVENLGSARLAGSEDIVEALNAHSGALLQRSANLPYTTSLDALCPLEDRGALQSTDTASSAVSPTTAATHLLIDHTAQRLTPEGIILEQGWRIDPSAGTWELVQGSGEACINGSAVAAERTRLFSGDRIAIANALPATLIYVKP